MDRRKYARLETEQVISFSYCEDRNRLAQSKDLSRGGIRFEAVGCEIDLGEVLRVTFNIEDETIVAVGKVVWATELEALTSEIGIEFVEVDPQAARLLEQAAEGQLEE